RGFVPYGGRLFDLYAGADVFLLLSRSEGTPKVVPEAFSFGLPVIASGVGGVPDMVNDGENGILLPALTAQALSLALERLIDSPGELVRLSEGAFRSAGRYSIERQLRAAMHEAGMRLCH
nr:glycosyltransferase [Nitrospiraceae bacterium]